MQLNPSVPCPFLPGFSLYLSALRSLSSSLASLFTSPAYSFRMLRSPLLSSSLIRFLPYPLLLFLLLSSSLLSLSSSLPFYFFLFFFSFFFFFVPRSSVSLERCAFACFFSASRLSLSLSLFLACLSRGTRFCRPRFSVFSPLLLSPPGSASLSRRMKYFARAHLFASAPAVGRALLYYEFRSLARSAHCQPAEPAAH